MQTQAGEVDMFPLIGLSPTCYAGDIQATNSGYPDVNIHLQYKKWTEVWGKWLGTILPTKHKNRYALKEIFPYTYSRGNLGQTKGKATLVRSRKESYEKDKRVGSGKAEGKE